MTSPSDAYTSAAALARHARLTLSADDHRRLAEELSTVMARLLPIRSADLTHVPPLLHLHDASPAPREDEVHPSLPRGKALCNAPESDGTYLRTPRVL
ncbi:MAG: Asp-tRNA(Asn)/Glu-tRNA(Gln) amidotransferase subunit GatC [Bacteroidota bacterium]|nr:Asp-tRNA(Asn)/Glu-tRNA(Gln) amidotransferase subunit GatC [Bacteroidota bacterium]